MKYFLGVALILAIGVAGLFAAADMTSAAAQIETARAAQEAAKAAQIASAGQAASSFWLGAIAAVAVTALVIVFLFPVWQRVTSARTAKPATSTGRQAVPQPAQPRQMDLDRALTLLLVERLTGTPVQQQLPAARDLVVVEPEESDQPQWWG